jgi:hypothetical protein
MTSKHAASSMTAAARMLQGANLRPMQTPSDEVTVASVNPTPPASPASKPRTTRKKKDTLVTITAYIPLSMKNALRVHNAKTGESFSDLMRRLIVEEMDKW